MIASTESIVGDDFLQDQTMTDETGRLPWPGRLYLWATYRLYHEFAWAYDLAAWIVSGGRWDRWRRIALEYADGEPVLEIGFGTGALLLEMARRGWPVTGIDLSPAMQRVAARKLRRHGLRAPKAQAAVQALPFADRSFARVISTFPAPFITQLATLHELRRVLRPGGRLIVVGAVLLASGHRPGRLSRFFGPPAGGFLRRFTELAGEAGLTVRIETHHDPPLRIPVIIAERSP